MRIAWIGPMLNAAGGGASGVSRLLLTELSHRELYIDCYLPGDESLVPGGLRDHPRLRFICLKPSWEWNRWYSRNNLMAFLTGQIANLRAENRLARKLLQQHLAKPYDLVYQFSHIELSSLRRYRKRLPPIVMHPSVHAAGELRWHRKEATISTKTEKLIVRLGVRSLLNIRSMVQRRHIRIPARVLALSHNFAHDLISDYNVSPSEIDIIPNPIDLESFHPVSAEPQVLNDNNRTIILFVSRIALRKGVEQIVELSHRLNDLADKVEIQIVGYKSLWSDYMGLLKSINPRTTRYIGEVPNHEMARLYRGADLLVQPSKYEPFGLTVGEALACGVPVVASDKVGAAESVHPLCCRTFPCNDMEAFETEVRKLLRDIDDKPLKNQIARLSRAEAERLYSSSVIGDKLLLSFRKLISRERETSTLETVSGLTVGGNL